MIDRCANLLRRCAADMVAGSNGAFQRQHGVNVLLYARGKRLQRGKVHFSEVQTLVYDVNVEGVYRVTKAFAPMVMESKGRIAITGSIAGTLAWPGGSAYSGRRKSE